ncbi:MAG: dihydroorotase [Granulosicoccus sp.]
MSLDKQLLILRRPDDWHVHLRDGDMLNTVISASAEHFGRVLVMPNLVPPVITARDATAYRDRIISALRASGQEHRLTPLMTLYLTDNTSPADVVAAASAGVVHAVKLYPQGATTNSASGVSSIQKVMAVLEAMAKHGVRLCIHGEVTDPTVDIFDREAQFIESVLVPLRQRLPELKVVLEHVTTQEGVDYINGGGPNIAGTITPHHLMINRNHMLAGGIRPHYYCLPIVKRECHRLALIEAATSGDEKFFLGTDSAPHVQGAKENACGCAGVFNALSTLSCLATIFEQAGALDRLEAFTSLNGPRYYGLEANSDTVTLVRQDTPVEQVKNLTCGAQSIVCFDPGRPLYWRVAESDNARKP